MITIKQGMILIIGIILIHSLGLSQINLDSMMVKRVPLPEDIAYNCTELIVKYYNNEQYDSVEIVLDYWESKNDLSEPNIRMRVLNAIAGGTFNESIYDSTIIYALINYQQRMAEKDKRYGYEYNKDYYGYVPFNEDFDLFTRSIANELAGKQNKNSLEELYCRFYAHIIDNPIKVIQTDSSYSHTMLYQYYYKIVDPFVRMPDYQISLMTGLWVPNGNLYTIGMHPSSGIRFGAHFNKMTYNVLGGIRFIRSPNEYTYWMDGAHYTTDYYFGYYFGIDIERNIIPLKIGHIDVTAGACIEGFNTFTVDTTDFIYYNDKGNSINSRNLHIGLGYTYQFSRRGFMSLQATYNFLKYENFNATLLNGDATQITFIIGMNIRGQKDYYLSGYLYESDR